LYKAPSGDVDGFLRRLDATLKYLYNSQSEVISSGDININYLNKYNQKKQVSSLLKTHIDSITKT
jgi:hypothetical protein